MMKRGKRGQLTIFIILAILIVAIVLFIFLFWPKLKASTTETDNPYDYIRECIEDEVEETVEILGTQGGVMEPTGYYIFDREKVEYLCYTNKNYERCVVQHPLLISSFERELLTEIEEEINACFNSLENSYENKGYRVTLVREDPEFTIEDKRTYLDFNAKLSLSKGDSQEYENFYLATSSNLFDILSIAAAIVQWERDYGDAPTDLFMDLYDYKIEKHVHIDGTHVYVIEDKEIGTIFQFASRSLVRPQGITLP